MQLRRSCTVFLCLAVAVQALVVSGCGEPPGVYGADGGFAYISFLNVPGVTAEEIEAIERIRARRDGFVFAMIDSAEAFLLEDGSVGGFGAYFASWLGRLFGIPFTVKILEWDELIAGLESGEIDFTGELFLTGEPGEPYFMAGPISEQPVKLMRLAGLEPLHVLEYRGPLRYVFLEGSAVYGMVSPYLREEYTAVFVGDRATAHGMVRGGEVDAFVGKINVMPGVGRHDDMEIRYFLPIKYIPVSVATRNPELEAFVSVVQKAIDAGAGLHLARLSYEGASGYLRWRLAMRLSPEERAFVRLHSTSYNPVRIVAEHGNYPAAFFNRETGAWEGVVFDILDEITRHTGLYFVVTNEPDASWYHLEQLVYNGWAAMFTEMIWSQETEGRFLWGDAPFRYDYFALVSSGDVPFVRIAEVPNFRVGTVADSAAAMMFRRWFPYHPGTVEYPCVCEAFDGLFKGDVDLLMAATGQLLAVNHFFERPGFKVNLVFENQPANSYFAFNVNETVLASVVSVSQALVDTNAIFNRWEHQEIDYRVRALAARRPWIIGVFVLVPCVLFLVLFLIFRSRLEGKRLERLVNELTVELQQTSQEAVSASYVKSEFLANMSHEIRTPLNAIIGMTAIARSADELDRINECLTKIEGASHQLMKVINDILDVSKIEARKFEMARDPFVFGSMVRNVVNIIEVRAGEKNLHFTTAIDENIPPVLIGDDMRLSQVLINLLSNAVKFTHEGGDVGFAVRHVSQRGDRELVEFMVRDSGIGIAEDQHHKMFDAFAQADSGVANRFGGTGLGLPISKSFVELMGGEISVESALGVGTCFTVKIPFEIGNPDMAFGEKSGEPKEQSDYNYAGRTLLLVEDVEINREIVMTLLEDTGVTVDCAGNGQIAVDMFTAAPERYDLVFMDIQMPVLDGYIATRAIRALDIPYAKTVPIVAMTANAFADDVERCRAVGMNDHISKPIEIDVLMSVTDKYLGGKKA